MIKKLRFRFIRIAMLSMAAVLGSIIAFLNIANYVQLNQRADSVLTLLASNSGSFPLEFDPFLSGGTGNTDAAGTGLSGTGADNLPFYTEFDQLDPSGNTDAAADPKETDAGESEKTGTDTNTDTGTAESEKTGTDTNTDSGATGSEKNGTGTDSGATDAASDTHGSDTQKPGQASAGKNAGTEQTDAPRTSVSRQELQMMQNLFTEETPFETRYFTVTLDAEGNEVSTDTGQITAISEETAVAYAAELLSSGKTDGFLHHYKYTVTDVDDGTMYIFVDCSRELSTFTSSLISSLIISAAGLFGVFLLVLFFSARALKPVAESYEKQKRFITDASHELKTPLTIIDASADVLEMEQGESQWTVSIKNQVRRLSSLVEKLVFLARMDEENTQLDLGDFSLSEAILDVAEPYEALALSQEKTLTLDITPGLFYRGNEASVRRLVSLLLDNAMKYSDEHGQLSVSLKKSGKHLELKFRNSVASLPEGDLNLLFDRFYRADASRNSKTGGFGIGLSVVRAIVTAHRGTVSVKAEGDHTIAFTVLL